MLVLTRKLNEVIKIGTEIEIKIVEIKGNMVRLGVTAPRDVSVHRKEIYDIIQKENILASKSEKVVISTLGKLVRGRNLAK